MQEQIYKSVLFFFEGKVDNSLFFTLSVIWYRIVIIGDDDMRNNKGFSLVELLGVITILGILMSLAIGAAARYKNRSINEAYKALSSGAANAAEEYFMDNMNVTTVSLQKLVEQDYLDNANDPAISNGECTGTVKIASKSKGDGKKVDVMSLDVSITCSRYNACVRYYDPNTKKCS